ncbi:MAG: DNA polymerase/3'-5' exonuclease PolX [Bacteroidetes bacterium]|nr:MAG: DNA polymerase/3'-5' exonuclease PolX [Bacteroidota bacterium]
MKSEANKELSRIFKEMSAIYQYIGVGERFRALAYGKASKVIGSLAEDISTYIENDSLKDLPGIGEGISGLIKEYIRTGKIRKYESLKKNAPHELIEMMEIKGFGPQSLKRIHNELKVSTKAELIKALQEGKIEKLKGFGKKKTEGMLRGLKLHKTIEDRMLLWDALDVGEKLVERLKQLPEVKQAELCGSLRRRKETVGDIDILVSSEEKYRRKIIDYFTNSSVAKQILAKGDTKASIILKDSGRQADLRIVNENEWGSALQYFTGSKEHNIHLRTIAKEKGYKISEYGIFLIKNDKRIAGKTEEEIYRTIGFQIMPPEMREDKGEIELASKNKIPKLVSLKDIKGDLQMHSVWSDGLHSIEAIAEYVKKNFSYEYIVITDHSKSSRIANGMDEKQILKQIRAIEEANKKMGHDFVKTGIEVDILGDGSLDISDEILAQLDWVTASIHSGFKHDNTDRIIRACENPYVNCIGHPTGRLIGSREPYKVDVEKIIEVAKETNTALEINAQPERMDLNDEQAMLARKNGIKLVISTDSHTLENFSFMKLGIFIARRAWCTPADILNTMKWSEIEKWKRKKHKVEHVV